MTSPKQFALSIAVAALVIGFFNVVVTRMARSSVPRQLLNEIAQKPAMNVVALGHSQIASDFDAKAFDLSFDGGAKSFNSGLGATDAVEHLLLLRRLLASGERPKLVIYGFFDFALTAEPLTNVSDLYGNRAVSFYLEPAYAAHLYVMPLLDRLKFAVLRHLPMFVDRAALWGRVEILRRRIEQIGLPVSATNRFGRVRDFEQLEPVSASTFAQRAEQLSTQNAPLSAPVKEMLAEVEHSGGCTIVVEMPMHPEHQQRFYDLAEWSAYQAHVAALLEQSGACFVNAGDWIESSNEFADHLHLNPAGALEFSRRLGVLLRSWNTERGTTPAGCRRCFDGFSGSLSGH